MATPVEAPKLGNTVEECLVSRWAKHKGDAVAAGDVVAEIETDKATFEVTAPVGGVVLETFFDEGALVPVFTNLFVIGAAGESAEGFRPGGGESQAEAAVERPLSVDMSVDAAGTSACATTERISPRARRFAREHRVETSAVNGSGPGGRILELDLRKIYDSASRMSTMRERIARRMRESLSTTAQYTMHAAADARGLLAVRARVKRSASLPDININELVTFCTIEALLEIPDLNAEFSDGRIRKHADIHVGFACDTPRGLLVPVVRDAHTLAIDELAIRMKELAARAVEGKLAPDDLSGATFTISNLGGLGIDAFTPILNPPQVAILGVGAIQLKPVRRGGQIEFIDTIGLSLTCDHQVIDGAPGARFLKVLSARIEQIESIF
jgi:pyruvate dehydrogenase E2 component (dihydrolipoamide acetyltransferase)